MNINRILSHRSFLKSAVAFLGVVASMSLFATAQLSVAQTPKVLRLAHVAPANTADDNACKKFAELMGQKTKGALEVRVFPNAQLGPENQAFQQIQLGSIDMGYSDASTLAQAGVPEWQILSFPYLYRDMAHLKRVLQSQAVKDMSAKLQAKVGLRVIGPWGRTPRYMGTTEKPVRNPADLKGLKLRVPQNPLWFDMAKFMGTNPTPVNWGELYTALSQKTVEGYEIHSGWITGSRLYEVSKYLNFTLHQFGGYIVYVNDKIFQGLPADQRKAIEEAAVEAGEWQYKAIIEEDKQAIQTCKEKGMIWIENVNRGAIAELVKPMIPKYEAIWDAGLYEKISKM
jgi:TRAP-type transport system periplasmic protein